MARLEFSLKHGLPFGKGADAVMQYDVTLRELSVGDILSANEESEKVVPTPDGYTLVVSPTLVGVHTMRRQVLKVGCIQGPLSVADMGRLHPDDLALLNSKASDLDSAVLKEVTERGRSDAASAGS
jgi:phage FluMu protein gp41